jgi:hypothetical protein
MCRLCTASAAELRFQLEVSLLQQSSMLLLLYVGFCGLQENSMHTGYTAGSTYIKQVLLPPFAGKGQGWQ